MISNYLIDKFGKTVYVTFVITERDGRVKFEFLPPVSNKLKALFKSAGGEFYRIVSSNPKKIEFIVIENVKYYFSVERIRHGEDIHYGVHILYASTVDNEVLFFGDYDFPLILYRIHSGPLFGEMSETSCALAERVRKNTGMYEYLFDFLAFELCGFFENKKQSYFYKINDVIKYTIENYFNKEKCPRSIVANYISSNMYTQMDLNCFMFFMVNLFLVVIKYSQGTVEINFENNLKTLDTSLKGKFLSGFFENNEDADINDEWPLSPRHPAFSDFELIKCLANRIGVAFKLCNSEKDSFEIGIAVSKVDIVFSNLLRVGSADEESVDIPIYTVNIDDIIK